MGRPLDRKRLAKMRKQLAAWPYTAYVRPRKGKKHNPKGHEKGNGRSR